MRGERLVKANTIARRRFLKYWNWTRFSLGEDYEKVVFGSLRKTPKKCSCWMCRNRRKDEGPTFNELKQIEPP